MWDSTGKLLLNLTRIEIKIFWNCYLSKIVQWLWKNGNLLNSYNMPNILYKLRVSFTKLSKRRLHYVNIEKALPTYPGQFAATFVRRIDRFAYQISDHVPSDLAPLKNTPFPRGSVLLFRYRRPTKHPVINPTLRRLFITVEIEKYLNVDYTCRRSVGEIHWTRVRYTRRRRIWWKLHGGGGAAEIYEAAPRSIRKRPRNSWDRSVSRTLARPEAREPSRMRYIKTTGGGFYSPFRADGKHDIFFFCPLRTMLLCSVYSEDIRNTRNIQEAIAPNIFFPYMVDAWMEWREG